MGICVVLGTLALLQGCASMSENECLNADWRLIGQDDGQSGKPRSILGAYRKDCAQYGGTPNQHEYEEGRAAILIMATVNHFMLSQLSKLARLEAEMSRNIDFYALLAPEMAGITFVAFDQQPK